MRHYLMLGFIVGCLGAATPCFAADTPVFLDAATGGPQSASSLTIQKNFATTSTNRYLFYVLRVQDSYDVESVTWHSATMTHLLSMSQGFGGAIIRVYGLANPDVGSSYDAVATMESGGIVGDGLLLLYGGVSSTAPITAGSSSSGSSATQSIGSVTTTQSGALAILISDNGTDLNPTPNGDAVLRAATEGFATIERGPLYPSGYYSISATFGTAAHSELAFSVESVIPPSPPPQPTPIFLDSATGGPVASSTLVISKSFTATSTNRYLFYALRVQDSYSVQSVTWHNATMTHLLSMSEGLNGSILRVYGLANPDVGASYDAIATMSSGGIVGDGLILLYGGVSSTNPITVGTSGFGNGTSVTGFVTTTASGARAMLVSDNGTDENPTPRGDGVLRAATEGFAVIERGLFMATGTHSVSAMFGVADHTYITFAIEPAIPLTDIVPGLPVLLDLEQGVGQGDILTISKQFEPVELETDLFFTFRTDAQHTPVSVTWNDVAMTQQSSSTQAGVTTYLYGLADPAISEVEGGESYDAVAMVSMDGRIYSGLISLYGTP